MKSVPKAKERPPLLMVSFALLMMLASSEASAARIAQLNSNFGDILNKILTNEIPLKNKNHTVTTQSTQFTGELVGFSGNLVEL
jgi:hypothetical protein